MVCVSKESTLPTITKSYMTMAIAATLLIKVKLVSYDYLKEHEQSHLRYKL